MQASEAELHIRQWADEHRHITPLPPCTACHGAGYVRRFFWMRKCTACPQSFVLPETFMRFAGIRLAQLVESLLPEDRRSDWNVVKAVVSNEQKSVKIDGRRSGMIQCSWGEIGKHGYGVGLISVADVIQEDQSKLARILDKIEGTN